MDSFTSMKTKLEATGLYSIAQGTNIFDELKAYAAALDELFTQLDVMLGEMFISTAQSYGIVNRELLLGRERDNYPLAKRREMLLVYEQMTDGRCTPEAFEDLLSGYGLSNFKITENPAASKVTIDVSDAVSAEVKKLVEQRVKADFPTHLTVEVNFLSDTADEG